MMVTSWIHLIVVVVYMNPVLGTGVRNNICCTSDQWEGLAFLGYGTVFLDSRSMDRRPETAFSYINGSIILAYDFTNSRTFMSLNGVEQSPLIPGPAPYVTTIIADYKHVSSNF